MEQIEIERKWLLTSHIQRYGKVKEEEELIISQYYLNGLRYRRTATSGKTKYERIRKVRIAEGVNNEVDITKISESEFYKHKNECIVSKKRKVYRHDDWPELKFEFDCFPGALNHMFILEIEFPSLDYQFVMPPEINKYILLEVTHLKEFNNYNLVEHIKK